MSSGFESPHPTSPIGRFWAHPDLVVERNRPRRKVHLDFHNSHHEPRIARDFDAEEFADRLALAAVDTVVLFGKDMHGNFYYPTAFGPEHPGLDGRDLLGEQIVACRARGISVYVYYCTTWDNHLAETHPEWLALKRDGSSYLPGPNDTPGWTALCLSNPDFIDLMLAHSTEILERYRPDGIWYDMPVPNWDVECFCANCVAAIESDGDDPGDLAAQRRRMQALLMTWLSASKANTEAVLPGCDIEQNNQTRFGLAERAALLSNVEIEALPTGGWGYGYFPVMTRFVRALGLFSTGMTGRFLRSWADFGGLKSVNQLRLEVAAIASTGAEVCIGDQALPSSRLDPATYDAIGAAYRGLVDIGDYVDSAAGVAEAAIYLDGLDLTDFASKESFGDDALSDGVFGLSRLLIEHRVQFDVVQAGTVPLDRYRVVLVAEGTALSADAHAELDAYALAGGRLVDSTLPGDRTAPAPWLKRAGIRHRETSPFSPAYLRVTDGTTTYGDFDFALYDGAERWSTDTLPPDIETIAVLGEPLFQRSPERYTSHAQSPVAVVTDAPVVLAGDDVAAFAFPVATSYYRHGYWIYAELFDRVIDRILPDQLVRCDAPKSLEVSVTYQGARDARGERLIVHLVNYAGAVRRGSGHPEFYDEIVPQRDVTVSVRLDQDPVEVLAVRSGIPLDFSRNGDRIEVRVPEVAQHEAIVFRFDSPVAAHSTAE